MSDYLGHLVSRAFPRTTAVQPRLPSIFEPQARPRDAEAEPDIAAASATDSMSAPAGARPALDAHLDDGPLSRRGGDTLVLLHRHEWVGRHGDAESRAALPLARTAVPDAGELAPATLSHDLARRALGPSAEAPVAAKGRHADRIGPGSAAPPAAPASPVSPSERDGRVPVTDTPFARLEHPRPALEPPGSRPRVVAAHPGSTPPRRARTPFAVTRDGRGAEPAIHVSIGRVEIRAAAAPAVARASTSASTSSAMTLGEYLRQRRAPGER